METEDKNSESRLLWKLQLRTGRIDYCGNLRYVLGEQIIVETEDTDRENRLLWKLKIRTGRIDRCGKRRRQTHEEYSK